MPSLPELAEALDDARRVAIEVADGHLERAIRAYDDGDFPLSTFLAMTAIEEVGKASILHMGATVITLAAARAAEMSEPDREAVGSQELQRLLRDHSEKARQAATTGLYINAGADRRHGVHPTTGMPRTSGIVLLARSRKWMEIRKACLYVDFDLDTGEWHSPRTSVDASTAHYFVTMAHEVLAEGAWHGLSPTDPVGEQARPDFEDATLRRMGEFFGRTDPSVDIDGLWFLADPQPLRDEANLRELKADAEQEKGARREAKRSEGA